MAPRLLRLLLPLPLLLPPLALAAPPPDAEAGELHTDPGALAADDECREHGGAGCAANLLQLRGAAAASAPAGANASEALESGFYIICSRSHKKLCLQTQDYTQGAPLRLINPEGTNFASMFFIGDDSHTSLEPGVFMPAPDSVQQCVDVVGHGTENGKYDEIQAGTSVQVWKCLSWNADQKWIVPSSKTGRIKWASHPEYCLDVRDHNFTPGAVIQVWKCEEWNEDQVWEFDGPQAP